MERAEINKHIDIRPYDFRNPQKVSKNKIDLMRIIYNNYAAMVSTKLALKLKIPCNIYLNNIEESTVSKHASKFNDNSIIGVCETQYANEEASDKYSTLNVPRDLLYIIIDRLSGGTGETYDNERDYTDLELEIINNTYKELIKAIGDVHHGYTDMKTECCKLITKSEFSNVINYSERVLVMTFAIELNGVIDNIQICLPYSLMIETSNKMTEYAHKPKDKIKAEGLSRNNILGYLKASNVDLIGQLGKAELTLQDIADMQIGDVLVLGGSSNEAVTLTVGQEERFKGSIGTKNDNYAIKINTIINKGGKDDGEQ